MKKTTKTVKTPAPAPTTASATSKKAAPKKAVKAAPVAAPVAAPKAAPAPVKKAPAAVVPVKPKSVSTSISATVDVGFGNTLYLRGVGPGLSWDSGVALKNAGETTWTITLPESARPITFKFLINDETWSTGEDFVVESGSTSSLTPTF